MKKACGEEQFLYVLLYQSNPEAGIYDASYGLMLKGDGTGNFKRFPYKVEFM